jgi:uncharacterized protein YbaA (DUF1428 family)
MKKNNAKYVDGFVITIPKKNTAAYKKMAQEAKDVWLKYGALSYRECMIEDAKPKQVVRTFGKLTEAKPSETVWFSYIEFKNRKHRDQVNKKVMADLDKKYKDAKDMSMPFDMNRMSYGGFTIEV